jgi:hypothetical protein
VEAQDNGQVGRSLGDKTSSREQGPDFDLVKTLQTVVAYELHGATHLMC